MGPTTLLKATHVSLFHYFILKILLEVFNTSLKRNKKSLKLYEYYYVKFYIKKF